MNVKYVFPLLNVDRNTVIKESIILHQYFGGGRVENSVNGFF